MNAADTLDVLDESTLAELAGDDTGDIVGVLVAGFLDEAEERVAAIEAAMGGRDMAAVGFQAHALKSTAATYGAPRLSRHAAAIERDAREGRSDAVGTAVRDLPELWRETDRAFRARYLSD